MTSIVQTNIPIQFGATLTETSKKDNRLFLNFLASTTTKSLSDHQMEESAIEDMKQISSEHNLPTFIDHNSEKDFGQIVGVAETGPDEFRPIVRVNEETGNPIVDAPVQKVKQWIKENANMGASIGGIVQKLKIEFDPDTDDITFKIHNIRLYEMSATLIPALPETRGEVKTEKVCPNGFCGEINRQVQDYLDSNPELVQSIKNKVKPSITNSTKQTNGTWNWQNTGQIQVQSHKKPESVTVPIEDRGENMDEEAMKILKKMNENVDVLMTERETRIEEARKIQEKEEAEQKQNEILETLVAKASEVIAEKVDELVDKKLDEKIVKTRTHVQSMPINTPTIEDNGGGEPNNGVLENIEGIPLGEPAEYTPHIGGVVQKNAMTPEELAAKFG
jgi:hypothetical protein